MMLRSKIIAAGVGVAVALTMAGPAGAAPLASASSGTVAAASQQDASLVQVRHGRKGAFAAGAAVAGVGILAGAAIANSNRYGYAEPPYYAPPPVYYAPPAYYEPAPVYVAPRRYYSAPAYGYYEYGYEQPTRAQDFNYR